VAGAAAGAPGRGKASPTPSGAGNLPIPGEDYAVTVRLTLEEAYRGTEREFEIGPNHVRARIPKARRTASSSSCAAKAAGANGGPPGDLYLHITLEPHPLFKPNGHDLDLEVPIARGRPRSARRWRSPRWRAVSR